MFSSRTVLEQGAERCVLGCLLLHLKHMAIERIVNTVVAADDDSADEVEFELKIRPHDFANYIGQERLKKNIQLAITAARKRGEALDHVLLYGPPGLGKTTLAS